ncbi:MAG: ABC transporter ATP-binding protein [Peptostreptococcaceae bacterium]|nr:ABC transporter ATP-binding protein [Peptostreptococcaceae bacterium]
MISFSNVSFRYDRAHQYSLRDINFEIEPGEVVLITGLSGSGKSTLLKCLNGLIPNLYEGELTGEIRLRDKSVSQMSMEEISRTIGCVFQSPRSQFFTTNTSSEFAFAMENFGVPLDEMKSRIQFLGKKFRLEEIMDRDIFSVSSGERQKLSLACSLTLEPSILILDEPSSNLDYAMTMKMGEYITELKAQGYTIIVADHRYFYLKNRLDKVILLQEGAIQGIYTEEEFKQSDYRLRSFELFAQEFLPLEQEAGREVLSIEGLCYKDILDKVNLQLHQGEVLALIGKNGAGKTTLAKLICQMEKADSGKIEQGGLPLFILQDSDYQLFGTSVEHELHISPQRVSDEEVRDALAMVGLQKLSKSHPFNLSGGEKQRLQVATAYVSPAEVLVFDEPTSGLDLESMERVSRLILNLANEKGILVISHDYEFIRRVAGRIVYLENGKIKRDFKVEESSVVEIEKIFRAMEKEAFDEKK